MFSQVQPSLQIQRDIEDRGCQNYLRLKVWRIQFLLEFGFSTIYRLDAESFIRCLCTLKITNSTFNSMPFLILLTLVKDAVD